MRSSNLRALILAILGAGLIKVGVSRGVLLSMAQLTQLQGPPNGEDLLVETKMNWTWGCPSLRRQDVDELYEVVQIGTVVEIVG